MVHHTTIRVRFSETDMLGHVNNGSYFIYLEEARIDFFNSLAGEMNQEDWRIILASVKCDFLKQAYFNEQLRVDTQVAKIGNSSFQVVQPIVNVATGETVARGESTVVHFNYETQRSERIPDDLREKLMAYHV